MLRRGAWELDLPARGVIGVVRDRVGKPVAGVSFGGNRVVSDGTLSGGLPSSAITVFKGVTNADGTFEVLGLADGKWSIHFNANALTPPLSHSLEVQLPISKSDPTTIDVKLVEQSR